MQSILKEELYNYYIVQNLNQSEIAILYNMSRRNIGKLLKKYNIVKDKNSITSKRKETCLQKYGSINYYNEDKRKKPVYKNMELIMLLKILLSKKKFQQPSKL